MQLKVLPAFNMEDIILKFKSSPYSDFFYFSTTGIQKYVDTYARCQVSRKRLLEAYNRKICVVLKILCRKHSRLLPPT